MACIGWHGTSRFVKIGGIMENKYKIVGKFKCGGIDMVVIRMSGAACTMPKYEFNQIVETERKAYKYIQKIGA